VAPARVSPVSCPVRCRLKSRGLLIALLSLWIFLQEVELVWKSQGDGPRPALRRRVKENFR
jgi:hypothetical protein